MQFLNLLSFIHVFVELVHIVAHSKVFPRPMCSGLGQATQSGVSGSQDSALVVADHQPAFQRS